MKLRRTTKAQNPKKKKKERNNNNNNNNNNNKEKEEQNLGQRTCNKDLGQSRGHAARISVKPEDMQQEESTSRPYVCLDVGKKPLKIQQKPGIIFVTHGPSL